MSILEKYGWNGFFEAHFNNIENYNDLMPARVISQSSGIYKVVCEHGILNARLTGKFTYDEKTFPVTGDWVAGKDESGLFIIHGIIERKNCFSRKSKGDSVSLQNMGANIDYIFIITSADNDFSPSRISRYLFLADECNAVPVVVINKMDKTDNPDYFIRETENIAPYTEIIAVSAVNMENIDKLEAFFKPGKTILFTGSSGVGKSTLINILSGSSQKISDVREKDDKGRHTTTSRDIILCNNGGIIIDIPGIREVQLGGNSETMNSIFPEIAILSENCRFKDCTHTVEKGCNVIQAVENGDLSEKIYNNYIKMYKEVRFFERESSLREKEAYEKKYKTIAKDIRRLKKIGKITRT